MKLQLFTRLCTVVVLSLSLHAFSQPTLKLEHDSSWEIVRRQCTIRVLQLANLSAQDTGPLYLSIYARPGTGWDGTGSPGVLLARAPIAGLAANTTTNDIVVTTKARSLPPGEKFTSLLVETKDGRKFIPLDYVIYTSTYAFPRGQQGGLGSDDSMIGSGNIIISDVAPLGGQKRRAEYVIGKIQNLREVSSTGALRLAIYGTPEPFTGGPDRALLATRPLGQLAQGDFYRNLSGKFTLKRPGRGVFYLTLAVEEDPGTGFETAAYVTFPEPRQF